MTPIRSLERSDVVLALVVTFGVVGAGAVDWLQGETPPSRVPGVAGFLPFLLSAVVCMGAAILGSDTRRDPRWRLVSLVAATTAAALADPTYATLLAVVPLVAIARRASEPERSASIVVSGVLLAWLTLTEETAQQRAGYESILVLAIVMPIVVMFGNALRRSDQARILEARLARVDERDRLARDLHDSLGHNLLASSIQLRTAGALLGRDPDAATRSIELASRAVAEALAETRLLVDDTAAAATPFSLEQSLAGLVERTSTPHVPVSLEVHGDHHSLASTAQITLYRFAQEALANVMRHANASMVTVNSSVVDGTATLAVIDDGQGFDIRSAPEHTGLGGLRERFARHGGNIDISSEPGRGTTVTAILVAPA